MDVKKALDAARTAIQLAEEAADNSSRKQYLRLAHDYLAKVDLDKWVARPRPTKIIALDDDDSPPMVT